MTKEQFIHGSSRAFEWCDRVSSPLDRTVIPPMDIRLEFEFAHSPHGRVGSECALY